jgi:hypothetical protein
MSHFVNCAIRASRWLSGREGLGSACFATAVYGWLLSCAGTVQAETPRFHRDVRPILSQNCVRCHGPDATVRKADLRLDSQEGIAAAFGGGLETSEAWRRILSTDAEDRMPPPDSHEQLKPAEIETLRAWVESGAPWQGHWAFIPPVKAAVPAVTWEPVDGTEARSNAANDSMSLHPIDAFIAARLGQEGLAPRPEADRERLLRRVTFDLTGLPPTMEEVDAFLADTSSNAYETVVDRLLASRHHGERMAVAWLDAARYGDTSVFHADGPRDMWPWRDWVIEAFNKNMPYDQFTVEQLAGDLLPDAGPSQRIATGFNRNNATTDEGGAIDEEFRVEYAVDRVKTTSLVWLGLTMECAQCHDHKYDPISQQDYYRFFAYFNQAADPGMQTRGGNQAPVENVFDAAALSSAEAWKQELAQLEERLRQRKQEAETDFAAWATRAAAPLAGQSPVPGSLVVHLPLDEASGQSTRAVVADESRTLAAQGTARWKPGRAGFAFQSAEDAFIDAGDTANFERSDAFSLAAWVRPEASSNGALLARMDDGNSFRGYDLFLQGNRVAMHLVHQWPGNAIKVQAKSPLKPDEWQHVVVTYDGSSKAAGVAVYVNGVRQELDAEIDQLSDTIRTDKPLYVGRRNPGSPLRALVDDVRVHAKRLDDAEASALASAPPLAELLAKPLDALNEAERETLRDHYLNAEDAEYRKVDGEIVAMRERIATAERPVSTVMVMQELSSPRMTFILDRGNYHSPRKDASVQPGTPASLPPLAEDAPANRLGLARWMVRPDHPLTARVAVNRFWEMLMGTGIVRSVEDFGAQGESPSHEELLDWLAVDFVEHGWDVRRTIKQIVMSQAYRQDSRVTPELAERDPENRLYARGPRFRLQGEFIRDSALAASGLLVPVVGGPSVKPYQPPGLWEEVSISGDRFVQDHGEKLYRRSMYTYIKRSAPPPTMQIFDAPSREKCVLRRSRTNTPLQALVTMNDPQFVEAARVLAERAIKQSSTLEDQIRYAYRRVTGLRPSAATVETLKQTYEQEYAVYQADAERARKLVSVGEAPRDDTLDPAQHASMAVVCSILLNLDVTLTRG